MLDRFGVTTSFATRLTSLVFLVWVSACKADSEPVERYHVRGLIKTLSGTGAEARVTIHHEAVANFKDRDGHASDMPSMKMIFGLGPKVSADQLHEGDKLGFDFEVHWSSSPTLVVTKVDKLAADTALTLQAD